ncbi:hypothetical protein PF010_g29969 [Phytophthora fragariae]|uniref:Uncharacterized protein n=3 Tax=Phytophthora fragariae TaxID=53985 RepID=A0A6A3PNC5_9STRA|nr:hypothetical protein PF003_g26596 [Phytophthora fragariae]KAE8962183.1 hypothetical protein PF011_g29480 [Phytophthora fragariae]KAE9061045.1 hypothetical protein PF010_g29969 [Phytophthora fragariae]KAE9062060.1 hypothetical protein PF007_g30047 [Phytophthora fragariae]KAE9163970.1 hypothetical protein PF004_g29981 [Phytophthora fragariae]
MAGHQREDSSLKSTLVCVGASLSLLCACQVGGNAPVKLPGAVTKAAATQARRLRSPSLQLRRVEWRRSTANKNYNDGKNVNASNKSASMNATAKATKPNADMNAKSTAPFALNDVTAGSVHRAHLIRNTDFERLQKLYNFFVANVNAKGEHVDQVRGALNSKTLAYIHKIQENRQALHVLLIVSTTLAKYGERSSFGATASVR